MDIRLPLQTLDFISQATIELSHAMGRMARISPCIVYVGSNRCTPDSQHRRYYDLAVEIAEIMGREGWHCITGGGEGISEAASLGAGLGKALSIGIRQIPTELKVNRPPNVRIKITNRFNRKVLYDLFAEAYIFFPGGFGTLDALFEVLTLIQTRRNDPKPVICVGKEFWQPILKPILDRCVEHKTIDEADLKLIHITDDYHDVARLVWQHRAEVMKTRGKEGLPAARSASSRRAQAFSHRVALELIQAFNTYKHVGKGISIFGSARTQPKSKIYTETVALADQLGKILLKNGTGNGRQGAIITGGGPGNMEAANRGAQKSGAPSLGLGIDLALEQGFNPYVDSDLAYEFHYFFCRKWLFADLTDIFIATPGGFGTLDELFEMMANAQFKLTINPRKPVHAVLCINNKFWEEPLGHLVERLLEAQFIAPEHKKLMQFHNDSTTAISQIKHLLST